MKRVTVKVSELEKDPCNFRKDTGDLTDLKESLKNGQYKPIIIRYIMDKPHVLCGWRTVLAAKELGMEALEAVVVDVDDLEALRMSWLDNESLKPWSEEERKAHVVFLYNMFKALGMDRKKIVENIAKTLNRSERWVYQYLPEKEEKRVEAGKVRGKASALKRKIKEEGETRFTETASVREGKVTEEKKKISEVSSEKLVGGGEPVKTKKPRPRVVSGTIVGKEDLSWIWSIYELDNGIKIAVRGSRVFAGVRGRDFKVGERVEAVLDWSYLVRGAPEAIELKPLLGELPVDIEEEIQPEATSVEKEDHAEASSSAQPKAKPVEGRKEEAPGRIQAREKVETGGGKPSVVDVLDAVSDLALRFQARLLPSDGNGSKLYEIACEDGTVVIEVNVFG